MKEPRVQNLYREDCLTGLRRLPDSSVDLVFTSPPYADLRDYARIRPDDYVDWFLPRARQIHRVLTPTGSFILNINDRCVRGARHLYVHRLVIALVEEVRFRLIDTYIWHKPNPMPGRYGPRLKDAFEYVFWFGRTTQVKFRPRAVGVPYKRVSRDPRRHTRNSGRRIASGNCFRRGWADPGNVVMVPVNARRTSHPAVMPEALAEFFIKLATDPGDLVVDPFAGSGTTLKVAERLGRKARGYELCPTVAG